MPIYDRYAVPYAWRTGPAWPSLEVRVPSDWPPIGRFADGDAVGGAPFDDGGFDLAPLGY